MAKATGTKAKRTSQMLDEDSHAAEAHKKTRTAQVCNGGTICFSSFISRPSLSRTALDAALAPSHQSSRANMGRGGQKAQLQNIERIQTQTSARSSRLEAATAGEPLNPMAPIALGARMHPLKESLGDTVCAKHLGHLVICLANATLDLYRSSDAPESSSPTSPDLSRLNGRLTLWFQTPVSGFWRASRPSCSDTGQFHCDSLCPQHCSFQQWTYCPLLSHGIPCSLLSWIYGPLLSWQIYHPIFSWWIYRPFFSWWIYRPVLSRWIHCPYLSQHIHWPSSEWFHRHGPWHMFISTGPTISCTSIVDLFGIQFGRNERSITPPLGWIATPTIQQYYR